MMFMTAKVDLKKILIVLAVIAGVILGAVWLLGGEESWTGYSHVEIDEALTQSQQTDDVEQIRAAYATIDRLMQQEVPMFSAYIIRALGAVNNRVVNARPDVFGSFINVHEWEIQ